MAVPAVLGIRVALDRPCGDEYQDAFLRRTKIGGSSTYVDGNDRNWTIDNPSSGVWVGTCESYSPTQKQFGSSYDALKKAIDRFALENKSMGDGSFSSLGFRFDANGGIWFREDRWKGTIDAYPPKPPPPVLRYRATSSNYSPEGDVEGATEGALVDAINAFANTHTLKGAPPDVASAPPKTPLPGPGPTVPATPSKPGVSPFPTITPPKPSPAPVPVPVAKAEGGTLLYAGAGVGVAALIGWALLS